MQTISVKVMGREIDLHIEDGYELDVHGVVDCVNDKFEETKKDYAGVVDTQKIAALTAIKLAAELVRVKGLQDSISNKYERKISAIISDLGEVEKFI
ncbi:MAG: cell division protein ZapA [Elusimicrobia bacterium]|nr:cell division protein ZapA [Elusimicrobiota bacterium]